jgi:hypothetical protein
MEARVVLTSIRLSHTPLHSFVARVQWNRLGGHSVVIRVLHRLLGGHNMDITVPVPYRLQA